jgi:hypothetical protein
VTIPTDQTHPNGITSDGRASVLRAGTTRAIPADELQRTPGSIPAFELDEHGALGPVRDFIAVQPAQSPEARGGDQVRRLRRQVNPVAANDAALSPASSAGTPSGPAPHVPY